MDISSWKKILLQWITECNFMERNYYNIEQTDIEAFYQNYRSKHPATATSNVERLSEFLKEFYPHFEINFDDENCLSSADYIYAYSLLLHFCCVKNPKTFFHEICQRLPAFSQQCIAGFFKELLAAEPFTKEAVRHAIASVGDIKTTPPRLDDSFTGSGNSRSGGSLNSTSFSRSSSPLKTSKYSAGPQRISPSTPKSYLLEERTRELYRLRAQLETERYEKSFLETQIKQNEDEVQKLNNEHKRLLQEIQDLKNCIIIENSEGSASSNGDEHQMQKRLLKEISQKEQEILQLQHNVRTVREEKTLVEKKLACAEKETILCMNRIEEIESKVDELTDDIKERDNQIEYLTTNKLELEQFILETRSANANADINSSSDCLDNSFLRNNNNSNDSNIVNSPENLGASVVDVKLREKELENQQLKAELKYVRYEHRRLAKHLTKLTEEFDLPIDTISNGSSVDSASETEKKIGDESSFDEQISCEEQFSIFNSCVEKIDKFCKTEKNKIKQLEQEASSLYKNNENLIQDLNKFKNEIAKLEQKLSAKGKLQQELENSKQQLELALKKLENELLDVKTEKDKFCSELKSLQVDKEKLNEYVEQLKSKLESQQRESKELLASNKKHRDNEQQLLARLREQDKILSDKTTKYEEEVKHLSEKVTKLLGDIELYKQTEKTIKNNNEQLVIQNEQLKKDARQANTHLGEMRKDLKEKEEQLASLGKEISDLKQKNEFLEKNISTLSAEHKKELLTSSCAQAELKEHLGKLKERFTKMELLMDSKQHECDLKQRRFEEMKAEIVKILKLFTNTNEVNDDEVFNVIKEVKVNIKNVIDSKNDLNIQVSNLQDSLKESLNKAEKLALELKAKDLEFEKSQANNLTSEKKIAELQQQQFYILEKSKKDLYEKEREHKTSLERIASELKSEKEYHSNKEMELMLIKAEINDTKKKLNEAIREIENLYNDKQQLQKNCERLKQFETRMIECSEENNKLRHEIETFKQQVTQNALRLVEADKALAEFVELTKEQDSAKNAVEVLQNKLKEKEKYMLEIEFKLQQQSLFEQEIEMLKQQLDKQNDLTSFLQEQKEKLDNDKTCLSKEVEEKNKQISKEHQDKLILLNSLEKSADQLKSTVEEAQQQKARLEANIRQLTEQNTKLQGDLIEREAELRLALDEQLQEKDDYQQKLSQQMDEFNKVSDQLENMDILLMEIVATMEKQFSPSQDLEQEDETQSANHIQKLRKHLNNILLKQQNLNEKLNEITAQKEEAVISLATLQSCNNDLVAKLNRQEKALRETQELLQNEELIMERKAGQEVKRLEEDLLNLEKVNDHLTNENVKIQANLENVEQALKESKHKIELLEDDSLHLKQDIHRKSLMIENLQQEDKKLKNSLKEKCQQLEKQHEKCKSLETQFKDKTARLLTLEKEYQVIKEKADKSQQRLSTYQQTQLNQQAEYKKLQEKLKSLQASNDSLEADLANKNKENMAVKNKNSDLLQQQKNQEHQHQLTSQKLDEMVTNKLNAETKYEQLQSEVHQLKRDLDLTKVQHQAQLEDNNRLNQEIESLKADKQHLREEVHENKLNLQRANENVTQLIQQISSIRLEKEAALEEGLLLGKQLEETGKTQTSSETKMKSVIEKSQELERKLLAAENELKTVKSLLGNSESSTEKLQLENKKLRDNQEVSTKRIEKLALKLGDSQARSVKLERENDKLGRTLEAHVASAEALQREKVLLQSEAKTLKERLSRAERGHEQLVAKVQNLEHLNTNLQQNKQKLEASDIDYKTKINKLEKMREIHEERIRKLTNSVNNTERDNVQLNLEIGALNMQLQTRKVENDRQQTQKIIELNHELTETKELQHKYEEINEQLKIELDTIKEENSSLSDKLSKASLSLQITSKKCERFAAEMEQIRTELLAMKQEKTQIEQQHETSMQKITHFEYQNAKITALEQKIGNLEEELAEKSKKVVDLEKEIKSLQENSEHQDSVTQQNSVANLTELEDLQIKISLTEDMRLKDQQTISQLRFDNQILHTKYQESKQRLLDAAKKSEERIKENRLELEAKLEKMKNKMKTLCTEEIAKMKAKQDREMAVIKSEMEILKTQNSKYEEHTRKLSNQIVRLNDNILQHQKDNTILSTKLKHLTDQLKEVERYKRPSSIHVSSTSLSTCPVAGPNIGPNLAMEDEEGEIFNTTYLTDLKCGRMTELMSRDVCVEELKYRNSMLPPHLRSTYAAQYDHEFHEDDIKDGPNSLDDSMSALLSTTASGIRKKCTGVTHYKRPGPPTPSKNGGRLSFGGNSEPTREILKESCDTNAGSAVSSSKTPARFNFFVSRFSMGNTRDEKPNVKRENIVVNSQELKIKDVAAARLLAGVVCTSTPRKSKVHFDQRRLLDQMIKSSPSPSPLTVDNKLVTKETKITPPNNSFIETPVTALDRGVVPKTPMRKTIARRWEAIAGSFKRCRRNSTVLGRRLSRRIQEICTPTSGETSSSALLTPVEPKNKSKTQIVVVSGSVSTSGGPNRSTLIPRRVRKKSKREKGSRPSIYLSGNIFAKYRTPKKGILFSDLCRQKSRKQRMETFNKYRDVKYSKLHENSLEVDKTISGNSVKHTISNLKDKHHATFNPNKFLGETVVIGKCVRTKQELIEDTFTFGEEQFEHPTELNNNRENNNIEDDNNSDGKNPPMQYDFPWKQELVTSQDLEDFDLFISKYKDKMYNKKPEEDFLVSGNLEHFEKMLEKTNSNAPFEIQHMRLNTTKKKNNSVSNSQRSSFSTHSTQSSHSQMDSQNDCDYISLSTATPHLSPGSSTCHLSRTIYGGTVIYNHRLPNINTTYVRKSSIYVKNCKRASQSHVDSSSCNDVVLITNQTITFVDIMRMWSQMDSSTRVIVSFAILASFTTLLGLFISLCSRR